MFDQLWATPATTEPAAAALACAIEAHRQVASIPGAPKDWDLTQAVIHFNQAMEHLQNYQSRT